MEPSKWALEAAKCIMALDGMAIVRKGMTVDYPVEAYTVEFARIIQREFDRRPCVI